MSEQSPPEERLQKEPTQQVAEQLEVPSGDRYKTSNLDTVTEQFSLEDTESQADQRRGSIMNSPGFTLNQQIGEDVADKTFPMFDPDASL